MGRLPSSPERLNKSSVRRVRDYLPFMLSLLLCSCCAVFRILFCSSEKGPRGELGRRIFSSTPSSTSRRHPLAASARAADLRPSNACAVDLMPQPPFGGSQGALLAPFGTCFLSLLGTFLVTLGGVGFKTLFLHRFGAPRWSKIVAFRGCRSA